MNEDTDNQAARFREIRTGLGFTQAEMAERLLLTRNYVAPVETGRKIPSKRLVQAVEVLYEKLLTDQGSPSRTAGGNRPPRANRGSKGKHAEEPNPVPTRAQLREQFEQLLDDAERFHGGLGYVRAMFVVQLNAKVLRQLRWPPKKG